MGNFDEVFVNGLKQQSWSLYSVGMFFILLRLYARASRLGGVGGYQVDDYLQMVVGGLYTALTVCLNLIAGGGGSNLYPPDLEGTFTPEEIRERVYGSKIVLVSEQAMLNVIYVIKACVLIMYTRLTLGHSSQKWIKYLAIYVVVGWVSTQITMFAACRPFSGYWGMPPPDPQCTTYEHYAIVQACFNISSDTLMLFIPLPLIFRLNMLWKQKIVLAFIFSLGIFVIVAALLTKIFNLSDVWSTEYMLWYIREASVAVYVSNLPMIWPMLREWFPFLRMLNPAGVMPTTEGTGKARKMSDKQPSASSFSKDRSDDFPTARDAPRRRDSFSTLGSSSGDIALKERRPSMSSSTDRIVIQGPGRSSDRSEMSPTRIPRLGGIHVQQTIVVEEEMGPRRAMRDLEKGVYDWDRSGRNEHRADVIGRRA